MTTDAGNDPVDLVNPIDAAPPTDVPRHGPYQARRLPALPPAVANDPIGNSGP